MAEVPMADESKVTIVFLSTLHKIRPLTVAPKLQVGVIRNAIALSTREPLGSIGLAIGGRVLDKDDDIIGDFMEHSSTITMSVSYPYPGTSVTTSTEKHTTAAGYVRHDVTAPVNDNQIGADCASTSAPDVSKTPQMNQIVQELSVKMKEILEDSRPAIKKAIQDCMDSITTEHPEMLRSFIRSEMETYLIEEEKKILSAAKESRFTRSGIERLVEQCHNLNDRVMELDVSVNCMKGSVHELVIERVDSYWQQTQNRMFMHRKIEDVAEEIIPRALKSYLERDGQPELQVLVDKMMPIAVSNYLAEGSVLHKRIDALVRTSIHRQLPALVGRNRHIEPSSITKGPTEASRSTTNITRVLQNQRGQQDKDNHTATTPRRTRKRNETEMSVSESTKNETTPKKLGIVDNRGFAPITHELREARHKLQAACIPKARSHTVLQQQKPNQSR